MDKKQRYYEYHVKQDICKLFKDKKYSNVIKLSSKYLEILPKDQMVKFMRAKSYRKLHMYDEAIEELKSNLEIKYNEYSLVELYFLYYYLNMYNEAMKILPLIYKTRCINAYSASISELVMRKQLGINFKKQNVDKYDYIKSQINSYNPDAALNCIKNHSDTTLKDETRSYFNKNINVDYLFEIITNSIDNSKKVNTDEMLEIHYFSISNIGVFKNNVCNFLKVVVIPNTNNIIVMYPTDEIDYNYLNEINIDYDKLIKKENNKLKRISQIDKFNAKYNKSV